MNRRAKVIKFVETNKKQIIFALFALLYFLDIKNNTNILRSAAPVVALPAPLVAFQLRPKGLCLFEGGPGRDHPWQSEAFLEDEIYDETAGKQLPLPGH